MSRNRSRRPGKGAATSSSWAAASKVPSTAQGAAFGMPHEPSEWMRQVLREVAGRPGVRVQLDAGQEVTVLLTPTVTPGSREDYTCDRCRTYMPNGRRFHLFAQRAPGGLVVLGGLCAECARLEGAA